MQQWQKYAAEVVGTMILVGVGTGAILAAAATATPVQAAVPIAFGLALLAGLYAVGEVSGGHFNPAVTLGMFLDRRISLTDMVGYWISQFAGGILGSAVLAYLTSRAAVGTTYTFPSPLTGISDLETFVAEVVFTAIFMWVILAVTVSAELRRQAFLGVSLALAAVHFVGFPLTGSSVNPARSFAPFVVGDPVPDRSSLWIYLVAPLVGAVIAWVLWKVINHGDADLGDEAEELKEAVT